MNEASEIATVVSRVPFYTPERRVAMGDEFYASNLFASEIDSGTLLAAIAGLVGLRLWGRSKKTLRAIW